MPRHRAMITFELSTCILFGCLLKAVVLTGNNVVSATSLFGDDDSLMMSVMPVMSVMSVMSVMRMLWNSGTQNADFCSQICTQFCPFTVLPYRLHSFLPCFPYSFLPFCHTAFLPFCLSAFLPSCRQDVQNDYRTGSRVLISVPRLLGEATGTWR